MTRHQYLIDRLCTKGWSPGKGWITAIRDRVLQRPWCGDFGLDGLDISWLLDQMHVIPDAYRLHIETMRHGWGHSVLIVELAEVVVTHPIPAWKMKLYNRLWWWFDGSEYAHMRLYVVDRFGAMTTLMDVTDDETEGKLATA